MPLKQTTFNFDFLSGENMMEEKDESGGNDSLLPGDKPGKESLVQEIDVNFNSADKIVKERSVENITAIKKSPRGRMKLSDMNAFAELIEVPEDKVLFEKSYYSIGTVSDMFKVNQSLIRFWENEFDILKPRKNAKGDRFFRPEDVKNLKLIYHLLRERKYTIEGAKEFLKKNKNADKKFEMIESLKSLKSFLFELKASL